MKPSGEGLWYPDEEANLKIKALRLLFEKPRYRTKKIKKKRKWIDKDWVSEIANNKEILNPHLKYHKNDRRPYMIQI